MALRTIGCAFFVEPLMLDYCVIIAIPNHAIGGALRIFFSLALLMLCTNVRIVLLSTCKNNCDLWDLLGLIVHNDPLYLKSLSRHIK